MVFLLVMYGCESWTIKEAEHQRTDAFSNCAAGKDAWESVGQQRDQLSQSLEEVSPEHSLEGLMLKLKLHPILWLPDLKSCLTGRDTDAGKDWGQEREKGDRGRDGRMASRIQWARVWTNYRRWWRTGKPGMLQSMELQKVRHDWTTIKSQTWLNNNKNMHCLVPWLGLHRDHFLSLALAPIHSYFWEGLVEDIVW